MSCRREALADPGVEYIYFLLRALGGVARHRALLRGTGRREEHRPAESEDVCQFRPDSAGRVAAAGEAALHRRCADPSAHVFQPPLRRFRFAPHRRAARRHHQAGAERFGGQRDWRPAAGTAHRAGPGETGGLPESPLQVVGALGMSNQPPARAGEFDRGTGEYLLETGEFLRTADDVRNVVVGVADDKPVFVRNVAEVTDGAPRRLWNSNTPASTVLSACRKPLRLQVIVPVKFLSPAAVQNRKGSFAVNVAILSRASKSKMLVWAAT